MTPAEFHGCYGILPEAMLLTSAGGRVLAANAAAGALINRNHRELPGVALIELVAESPQKLRHFLTVCSRSGQFIPGALTFKNEKHAGIQCRIEGALLRSASENDSPVLLLRLQPREAAITRFRALNERITTLNREIVERKLIEQELHAQRELLRTTLASIGDGVIATDAAGIVSFMNPIAESLTGWSGKEAVGYPLDAVFRIVNEHTRAPVASPVTEVRQRGLIVGLANHTLLIAKDGTERAIADSGAPIRDANGQLLGEVVVFRDVTDRRRDERALEDTNKSLQKSNDNLRQFAYAAAHDLKEPLRMVSLYSQLLARLQRGKLSGDTEKCLEQVQVGAARMEDLLDGLFAFVTAGEVADTELLAVDCNDIVAKAIANLYSQVQAAGAEVIWNSLPTITAQPAPLIVLFQNLIGNAIKYHREQEAPRVSVAATRRNQEWLFVVADNGIGIEPEYHRHIFGVFKRLHPAKYPGTGIGLALCARVVEGYGGTIWVESEIGEGSRFLFTIPDR